MLQEDEIVGSLLQQIQSINHTYQSKQWSMITIRESIENPENAGVSVFPPANHENLQIPSHPARDQRKQQDPSAKSSSPSPSLSLAPSDLSTRSSKEVKVVIGWLDFGLEILRAKIWSVYSWFCKNGHGRGSFGRVAGVAVLVLWWWLCRRGRRTRERVGHLKLIIKEKDEKISKLLHQIAQMNEVLVVRHKVLASKLAN